VFDVDGTLADTMTRAPEAYAATIRALGGPDLSPADIVADWNIGSTAVVLAHFLGRPVLAADLECFYRILAAAVASVRLFPGVVEMLDTLDGAGYRLGVFTGATRRTTALTLVAVGLDGRFQTTVCGDDVDKPKPAPDGLRLACRRLGVDTAETAYVGDAEVDLRCAEAAGAMAIHAGWAGSTGAGASAWVARRPSDVPDLLRGSGSERQR
jgi:HAD superfamily hydrolase (TIGR01509 family)